ncbi:MAG TPA: tripartite tricarboxylate transporter TctB family protein [Nocardioides sp.]|nr:tripartite tricarboxylate transporter TctB family protein [Nocardioides sp.]
MSTSVHTESHRRGQLPVGELAMAGGVLALGIYALVRAGSIVEPTTAAGAVGPRTMPYLVGGLLAMTGAATLVQVLRGHRGEAEGGEDVDLSRGIAWTTVALLAACLVLHAFLVDPLGWPVAAAILFAGGAVTLGARPVWRAIVLGIVLALAIQMIFAGVLDVSLPAGPLFEGVSILGG